MEKPTEAPAANPETDKPAKPKNKTGNPLWVKGVSQNPSGRPKGIKNKATRFVEALGPEFVEEVVKKLYDMAVAGNVLAAKSIMDKFVPPAKEYPIDFPLPRATTAEQAIMNISLIGEGVSQGRLLPSQAETLIKINQSVIAGIDAVVLEQRLAEIERRLNEKS